MFIKDYNKNPDFKEQMRQKMIEWE